MPQILKQSVRQNIIKTATKQFNQVGYINTKMKDIAIKSNISVGNIYRYFKDKESLFESVVNPIIDGINNIFNSLDRENGLVFTNRAIKAFTKLYINNKEVFILVLENSNNTKFESIKKSIIEKFYASSIQFPIIAKKIENDKYFSIFMHTFSVAFINGVISILLEKECDKVKIEQIEQFLSFMRENIIREAQKGSIL